MLGILATRTGEPDVAVELIGRAIGLRPNSAEFYDNLADAFAALGRYDEAIAARRKAISLDKGLFRAYLLLGNLLGDVGRFEEAIATYRGICKSSRMITRFATIWALPISSAIGSTRRSPN